jgi:hypothetical protein
MEHQAQVKEILRKEMEKSKCPGCPHKIGIRKSTCEGSRLQATKDRKGTPIYYNHFQANKPIIFTGWVILEGRISKSSFRYQDAGEGI